MVANHKRPVHALILAYPRLSKYRCRARVQQNILIHVLVTRTAERTTERGLGLVPEPSILPPFDTFADPQLWLHFFLAPLFLKLSTVSCHASPPLCSLSLYPPTSNIPAQTKGDAGGLPKYRYFVSTLPQAPYPSLRARFMLLRSAVQCFGPWVSQCGLSLADIDAT